MHITLSLLITIVNICQSNTPPSYICTNIFIFTTCSGKLFCQIIFFWPPWPPLKAREAKKCSTAQGPHSEVVPRAFWRRVSKSCDECKGSFARGCEAKWWSHWTYSSLGTIFQPMRINSVTDVKCVCNNKNVLRAQSMVWHFVCHPVYKYIYTGCPRRKGQNFGRVFLMLNYTDITQNTYIQSWTVTEIMTIEKCGLLGCPRTVLRPWRHTRTLRMPGNQTPLASIVMQWPWRDNASAAACVNYLET